MTIKLNKKISLLIIAVTAIFSISIVKAEGEKSCWICNINGRNYAKYLDDEEAKLYENGNCKYKVDKNVCTELEEGKSSKYKCVQCKTTFTLDGKTVTKKYFRYLTHDTAESGYYGDYKCTDKKAEKCDNDVQNESDKESSSGTGSKNRQRDEEDIGGSLADESSSDEESPSSNGKIVSSNSSVSLPGNVCKSFQVCGKGKAIAGRPYFANQANWIYLVNPTCQDNPVTGGYAAFCLDPDMDGVYNGCVNYSAQTLDTSSIFNQWLYELYRQYPGGNSQADPDTYFAFTGAARVLSYWDQGGLKSDFYSQRSTTAGKYASHLAVWQAAGKGDCSGIGNVGARACDLARKAVDEWTRRGGGTPQGYEATIMKQTLGLRINQLGGFWYDNDSKKYKTTFNVVVENFTGSINEGEVKVSWEGRELKNPQRVSERNELVYTVEETVDNTSDCYTKKYTAKLEYKSESNIRNAAIISANGKGGSGLQRFAVFASGGGTDTTVTNDIKVKIGKCDEDCNPDVETCEPACEVEADLVCDDEDGTLAVINEGSKGGGATDWDGCIIGKNDPKGNSYDVVNTSSWENQLEGNENLNDTDVKDYLDELNRDQIIARLTDGTAVRDSNYCIVSCKEKYAFLLPGEKKDVKQGTYFSFHSDRDKEKNAVVGVSAERLCVSNNIDTEKFKKNVTDLRKQAVDYLNMYLYYKQMYNVLNSKPAANSYMETATTDPVVDFPYGDCSDSHCTTKYKPTKAELEEKYKGQNWLKSVDGSNSAFNKDGTTITFKYYTIGKGLTDKLQEATLTFDFSKSFLEAMGTLNGFSSRQEFYSKWYGDYASNIWDTKIHVDENKDPEATEDVKKTCYKYKDGYTDDAGTYHSGSCEEKSSTTVKATITYWKEYDEAWKTADSLVAPGYDKYKEMLTKIKAAYELAKEKYNAIYKQIGLQTDGIQLCTNYVSTVENTYKYDPIITFSYPDEDNYMAMLAPNTLENMDKGDLGSEYKLYYGSGDPESLFAGGSSESGEKTDFKFPIELSGKDGESWSSSFNPTSQLDSNAGKSDTASFYNYSRIGSRSQYGRFSWDHNESCDRSKFVSGKGSKENYCYEFYQSAGQFYTYPPDGLVTLNKDVENGTILDHDGRVYPVTIRTEEGTYEYHLTFSNIGQYNESGNLGRLMGGSDPVLSGEYKNEEVCYYTVCRIDDPDCPGEDTCLEKLNAICAGSTNISDCVINNVKSLVDSNGKSCCYDSTIISNYPSESAAACPDTNDKVCKDKLKQYCNNGDVSKPTFTDSQFVTCVTELNNAGTGEDYCCAEMEEVMESRKSVAGSRYNDGSLPNNISDTYYMYCPRKDIYCTGFEVVTQTSTFTSGGYSYQRSDDIKLTNDGSLQVNARAVSLNNLFPSGNLSVNWKNSNGINAKSEIEKQGDQIFSDTPDYHITMNAECATAIKEYNNKQDATSSDSTLSNGGYNDYTLNLSKDKGKKGSYNTMDSGFKEILEKKCGMNVDNSKNFNGPDVITSDIDNSEVKS